MNDLHFTWVIGGLVAGWLVILIWMQHVEIEALKRKVEAFEKAMIP